LSPPWNVGIVGTFDVENYGDLLFPLIAEAELRRRLGDVRIHAFSYHSKQWPYEVTSVSELPQLAASLDGLLIGGGFLIRFDRDVAPGYEPPSSAIHHPTGYWLTPALIAHEHGVPVVWNAPGMHCNEIPAWAEPLLKLAFEQSRYIAVRDEPSREALSSVIAADLVTVVPDPGFGVARLLPKERSRELEAFRAATGINKPYILVQASASMLEHASLFSRIEGLQAVAMPISPVLTESADHFSDDFLKPRWWPHPLVLAELIAEAAAVAGHSYHLAITALMNGVPVFTPVDRNVGKFTALQKFDGIEPLPKRQTKLLAKLNRRNPPAVDVDKHWDRVASAVEQGRSAPQVAMSKFWQAAPALLEGRAARGGSGR
jgi:lipopolysaccharide transport system ATP-binding protein